MGLKDIPIKAAQSVRVNKIALLFLFVFAFTLEIFPAALIIARFDAIPYFAIGALITATIALYRFKSMATEKPSLLEYAIGWIATNTWGALTGLLLLFIYGMFLGGASLVVFIASWLGSTIQIDGASVASWISPIISFIPGLFLAGVGASGFAEQLYPNKAGTRSMFYELTMIGKRKLTRQIGFASFVFGGLFLWVFLTTGSFTAWWFNLLLLICSFIVSIVYFGMGADSVDPNLPKTIKAVRKLLEALECQVVPCPITGKSEFDPLLVGLDFFVQNKEHAFAVVVRTGEPQPKDKWKVEDLLRSTRTLKYFLQGETGSTHTTVTPVIIVTGKREKKWAKKGVKAIEMPNQTFVDKILSMKSQEEVRKIADVYLQFPIEHEDLSMLKRGRNTSGGDV